MSVPVSGSVAPGFESVLDTFTDNFESGLDVGATFAVVRDGEVLVDLWGGYADTARTTPLHRDALFNVWSTTKGLAATCIALLVERDLLHYDRPVSHYWPEFAAKGKERLTVGQMLSHQGGITGVVEPITVEDFFNHQKIVSLLAAQEPFWPPGTGWGYHPIVFGHLADELIRRADGRTLGQFFAEEVAKPLDADAFIGLPESEDYRQVPMIKPDSQPPILEVFNARARAANENPPVDPEWPNRRDWRAAGLGGAGGSANARSLARIYGMLARGGELHGTRLLSPRTLLQATTERIRGTSQTIGLPGVYAAGFALNAAGLMGPNPDAFGHGGYGGSIGFADPHEKLAIGYAMNRMLVPPTPGDPRLVPLIKATYASLREAERRTYGTSC